MVNRANRADELQRRLRPVVPERRLGGVGLEESTGLCLVAICEESPDVVRPLVRKAFGRPQGQERVDVRARERPDQLVEPIEDRRSSEDRAGAEGHAHDAYPPAVGEHFEVAVVESEGLEQRRFACSRLVEPHDVDPAEDPGLAAPLHHAAILGPQPRQLGDLLLRRARGCPTLALPRFPLRLRSPLGLAPSRLTRAAFFGALPVCLLRGALLCQPT